MSIRHALGLVALAATLGLPALAAAQTLPAAPAAAAPHHHGHHGWRARLRQLNLSDQQSAQINGFFADAKAKSQNADPATRKQIHQQLRSHIEGVLTPDQLAKFQAPASQAPAK